MNPQAAVLLIIAIFIVITGIIMTIKYHFDAKANEKNETKDKKADESPAGNEDTDSQDDDLPPGNGVTRLGSSSLPPEE